jgi:hypothetical protein
LMCHEEPAPEYHPRAHLREDGFSTANEWVRRTLENEHR